MRILGLSAGRKMGNNEILVKEALMAAEDEGAEAGMIRLLELHIKPCTGCLVCYVSLTRGGAGKCVLKDDLAFLDEQLMQCDGLIVASPAFVLGPHGLIKVLSDRLGPSHDVNFRAEAKKMRAERGITEGESPDERSFKKRKGAFIVVGGASTSKAASLALPLMNLLTLSSHIAIVDQMQVMGSSLFNNVVLVPGALDRARRLGRNVVKALERPNDEMTWMSEEPGTCPSCHSNLLLVGDRNPVRCPICGIKGELRMEDDRIIVTFSEEEQKKSHLIAVTHAHWTALEDNGKKLLDENEIRKKLKKYRAYKEISKD